LEDQYLNYDDEDNSQGSNGDAERKEPERAVESVIRPHDSYGQVVIGTCSPRYANFKMILNVDE